MFRKISFVVLAAAAVLTALTAFSNARALQAAPPSAENTTAVYSLVDGKAVPGSQSTVGSDAAGVTVALHTFGLPLGSDTELWWYVYNAPEQCLAGTEGARCGLADLWNKAAQPSAFYGASQKISDDLPDYVQQFPPLVVEKYKANQAKGKADFLMRRAVGDQKGVVFGAGVTNPVGAEIHLILVSCVEGEGPAAGTASALRSCEKRQYAVHQQQTVQHGAGVVATKAPQEAVMDQAASSVMNYIRVHERILDNVTW